MPNPRRRPPNAFTSATPSTTPRIPSKAPACGTVSRWTRQSISANGVATPCTPRKLPACQQTSCRPGPSMRADRHGRNASVRKKGARDPARLLRVCGELAQRSTTSCPSHQIPGTYRSRKARAIAVRDSRDRSATPIARRSDPESRLATCRPALQIVTGEIPPVHADFEKVP
jgi:hypothetical protein